MALKLRPTGLGSGIDKDRPDYTVVAVGGLVLSFALGKGEAPIRLSRQSRLLGRLSRSSPPKSDGNTLVDSCIPK